MSVSQCGVGRKSLALESNTNFLLPRQAYILGAVVYLPASQVDKGMNGEPWVRSYRRLGYRKRHAVAQSQVLQDSSNVR